MVPDRMQKKHRRKRSADREAGPPILSPEELDKMRAAGQLAAELLDRIEPLIAPGITTGAIDAAVHEMTTAQGAISAPYGYHGFPAHCCTSINEVVCHGIPTPERVLREGDIINVDVTPILDGWHGDCSRTFLVGEVHDDARRLVETTFEALWLGIDAIRPGGFVGDIGRAIQPYVEARGYSVVREFTGHGLGREFHCAPTVFHHVTLGPGIQLAPGMVLTVEPMINAGRWKTRVLSDGWTALTIDGKLSAQFEHTVAVTKTGVEVLTLGAREVPFRPAASPG